MVEIEKQEMNMERDFRNVVELGYNMEVVTELEIRKINADDLIGLWSQKTPYIDIGCSIKVYTITDVVCPAICASYGSLYNPLFSVATNFDVEDDGYESIVQKLNTKISSLLNEELTLENLEYEDCWHINPSSYLELLDRTYDDFSKDTELKVRKLTAEDVKILPYRKVVLGSGIEYDFFVGNSRHASYGIGYPNRAWPIYETMVEHYSDGDCEESAKRMNASVKWFIEFMKWEYIELDDHWLINPSVHNA